MNRHMSLGYCAKVALTTLMLSCAGNKYYPTTVVVPPVLSAVQMAPAVGVGSVLRAAGANFDLIGEGAQLDILGQDGQWITTLTALPGTLRRPASAAHEIRFALNDEAIGALGLGEHNVSFVLKGGGDSQPVGQRMVVTDLSTLQPVVTAGTLPTGQQYQDAVLAIAGRDFLAATEGRVCAHVEGIFTPSIGAVRTVREDIPMFIDLPWDRSQLHTRLTSQITAGNLGTFSGTIAVWQTAWNATYRPGATACEAGHTQKGAASPWTFQVQQPRIRRVYGAVPPGGTVNPSNIQITFGQYLVVEGDGFVGAVDADGQSTSGEYTIAELEGAFTPVGGGAAVAVRLNTRESVMVPEHQSATELRFPLSYVPSQETSIFERRLLSSRFGAAAGTFAGTLRVTTFAQGVTQSTTAQYFRFEIAPTKQVVQLVFLNSFNVALGRFGLAAASAAVRARVVARVQEMWADYNVDVRVDRPSDYRPDSFVIVEIGGPDPNTEGSFFGFENQASKDINNLNLGDIVGGFDQAAAQVTNGFGGVFVESYLLAYSSHPELPIPPAPVVFPRGATPEQRAQRTAFLEAQRALFDAIFDPVRDAPVMADELRPGGANAQRRAVIDHAVVALGNAVGFTAGHEFGHSLGLGQPGVAWMQTGGCPSGSACEELWHTRGGFDGCIMGKGNQLPTRLGEPGGAVLEFCDDEPEYLERILGR